MADEPNTPPPTPPANPPAPPTPPEPPDPEPKPDDVDAMKSALKKANNEAAAARAKLKELEDANKTEAEKLSDRASTAEQRASEAEARLLKLEIGAAKGLTAKQAARLVGTTTEELEADADELLATFAPANGEQKPPPAPGSKPKENLKPGSGDPDAPVEETDLKKLGERMFAN